jgi:hypothetical protein
MVSGVPPVYLASHCIDLTFHLSSVNTYIRQSIQYRQYTAQQNSEKAKELTHDIKLITICTTF